MESIKDQEVTEDREVQKYRRDSEITGVQEKQTQGHKYDYKFSKETENKIMKRNKIELEMK